MLLSHGWWNFENYSKIDVLKEPRHNHLILQALRDADTRVTVEDGSYILYAEEEALLININSPALRLLLFLYYTFLSCIGSEDPVIQ